MNGFTKVAACIALCVLAALPRSAMAATVALVDGVPGDSTLVGHQGWLNVDSISFGVDRIAAGGGFKRVAIVLRSGPWTADLAMSAASGKTIANVTLDHIVPVNDQLRVVSRIKLEGVRIDAFDLTQGGNESTAAVQIAFARVRWEFYSYAGQATVPSAVRKGGWDVSKNSPY